MGANANNTEQYELNWNNHMPHLRKAFGGLFSTRDFVDCTLYCEGKKLWAHKMLLSACSPYFYDLFRDHPCQHPIIILKGVKHEVLLNILKFIYFGEVSVMMEHFDTFMKTAEMMQISGLIQNDSSAQTAVNPEFVVEERPEDFVEIGDLDSDKEINDEVILIEPERDAETQEEDSYIDKRRKRRISKKSVKLVSRKKKVKNSQHIPPKRKKKDELLTSDNEHFQDDLFKGFNNSDNYPKSLGHLVKPDDTENKSFIMEHFLSDPRSLKCKICDKRFSHPLSLVHHRDVHSGKTKCPICQKTLSRKYHLKAHLQRRHNVMSTK